MHLAYGEHFIKLLIMIFWFVTLCSLYSLFSDSISSLIQHGMIG
jgi:hypothetical protein